MTLTVQVIGEEDLILDVTHETTVQDLIHLIASRIGVRDGDVYLMTDSKLLLPMGIAENIIGKITAHLVTNGPDVTSRQFTSQLNSIFADTDGSSPDPTPDDHSSSQMTHIVCRVNNVPLRMLVDTGAQCSIMYENQMTAAGIEHLLDRENRTMIIGVVGAGEQSLGYLAGMSVEVGGVFTTANFTVMKGSQVSGIIGMDWMSVNRVVLNHGTRCLTIQGTVIRLQPDRL